VIRGPVRVNPTIVLRFMKITDRVLDCKRIRRDEVAMSAGLRARSPSALGPKAADQTGTVGAAMGSAGSGSFSS
jgi:hypothetical protein